MLNQKKIQLATLIASILTLANAFVYPKGFIDWNIGLYAVGIVLLVVTAFLLFFSLFSAKQNKKAWLPALIGTAAYMAVLMPMTFVVNNLVFGKVAPWGWAAICTVLNFVFWLVLVLQIKKRTGDSSKKGAFVCILLLVVFFVVSAVNIYPNYMATNFILYDTTDNYYERMDGIEIYENTVETAIPMTQLHTMIEEHFNAPLPEGKTEKKVLVLGWDGCRADAMTLLDGTSVVERLLQNGGKAYIAYCGGANYPENITQATSTAPGWCSMLTGQWGASHGITGNGIEKENEQMSLFVTAIEDGYIDASAFYFSWDGHLTTYGNEIEYCNEKGYNTTWLYCDDDNMTADSALADLQQADCSDFIFTIFEYCDRNGHEYGYWNLNPMYQQAFADSNEKGNLLVDAVQSRPTYETEDWLILITSDHGGYVRGHGDESIMERMMFIVTSK
ncbi:MAG: alkaline phosphatase family protein [Clostridia bacterium]|nr:alkaline phosphatase family protein [Clostridia bacterium]